MVKCIKSIIPQELGKIKVMAMHKSYMVLDQTTGKLSRAFVKHETRDLQDGEYISL